MAAGACTMPQAGRIGNAACDCRTSLDNLQRIFNVKLVNLFVAWYGMICGGSCTLFRAWRDGARSSPRSRQLMCLQRSVNRNEAHLSQPINGNAALAERPDDVGRTAIKT